MGKVAFIFPGQGSQSIGMGLDFSNSTDIGKDIFKKFDDITGKSISNLCFEGPEEVLKQTNNTQPAILAVSIIAYELFKNKYGIKADYVAGHSLGEYSALYAAGVLSLDNVIKIVQKRADLMSQSKTGGMSAILGLADDKLQEVLVKASNSGTISVANYNTPDQTVITGESPAIGAANALAAEYGAKRVIPLAVSGAFHSQLMKPASKAFAEFIEKFDINDAQIPVVTNTDANPTLNKNEFKTKMVEQMYSSVYWKQSISYMIANGVDTFIELGPGKVLSGMVKKISRASKVYNIYDTETLNSLILT